MTATTNTIDMTTLNCPYGCGEKLVANELCPEGEVTCPTDNGYFGNDCEGEGVTYANADLVCDAVNDRVSAYKKALGIAYARRANLNARIEAQERDLARAIRLSERISKQHG
jgi:hypothetical protein